MENIGIYTDFSSGKEYAFRGDRLCIGLSDTKRTSCDRYLTVHEGARYLDVAFLLRGLKNVTLDFGGAVMCLRGRIQPFIIDGCENITIKNLTVEYERSLFTELSVVKNTGDRLFLKMKEKFPFRVENGDFIPYGRDYEDRELYKKGCMFIQGFDRETAEGKGLDVIYLGENIIPEPSPPAADIRHVRVGTEEGYTVFYGKFPGCWDENTDIVIEHENRFKSGISMLHSKNINIENYRILNGAGMGFLAIYCENISLKEVKFFRDGLSHGIVTNSADGVHFVACKGRISIESSVFRGMIDDALNIHSNYYHLQKASGNVITARRSSLSHSLNAYSAVFSEGDVIAVYNGKTLEEKKRFTLRGATISSRWTVELLTDSFAEGLNEGDMIENLSTNPEIYISGCDFSRTNTHLRFQSRGRILIENSSFTLPVMLTGDMNYWDEASPIEDFTLRDCRFSSDRARIRIVPEFTPTQKAPFYHRNVRIENNTFTCREPLEQHYADGVVFENNKILSAE